MIRRKGKLRVFLLSLAGLVAGIFSILWASSYEPLGPRYIEGPVANKYTILPRHLAVINPSERACIYASVVNGWIRIGRIDIRSPYGPAPRKDDDNEEGWLWLGHARFPGPELVSSGLPITNKLGGALITGSLSFSSGTVRGLAVPCWLIVAILLSPLCFSLFRKLRRRKRAGHCAVCDYDLTGLAERRCPECGTSF